MANNSELKILITGDASSAMGVLNSFSQSVKGATSEVSGHFASVGNVIESMAAPLLKITALLGGGALFKGAIDGAVNFSKEVGSLQRIMGGTSQQASVTAVAVKSIFGDVDTYETAAAKLVKTLNKSEGSIKAMGIATRDGKGHFRDMTELLPEVVQGLSQYAAGTDRDAAAQAIFGRSFKDMLKFAALTPEVMAEAEKKTKELGLELDKQSQGTIKKYRKGLVDVDEVLTGMKMRVALEVMPTLTNLSSWFSSTGPAAIQTLGGLLKGTGEVLGNTSVQIGIASVALNSLLPALGSLAIKIPLVSLAIATFKFNLGIAALEGTTGLAAIGVAAKGAGRALLSMINPWMVVGAGIVAIGYSLSTWAQSYGKNAADMAEANLKAAETAIEGARGFETQGKSLADLETKLKGTAAGSKAHREASEQLRHAIRAMSDTYPEFLGFLKKENGAYVDLAGSVERFNKAKIKELESKLSDEQLYTDMAKAQKNEAMGGGWSGIVGYGLVYKGIAENAEREQKAHEATAKAIQKQIDVLKGADKTPEPKHWAGGDGKPKANTYAEDMVRLQKQGLESSQKTTLEAERLAEVRKLDLQREGDLLEIQAKLDKGEIDADQAKDERQVVDANYANARMGVWDAYALKRKTMETDLQAKVTALEEGGLDKRLEAVRRAFDAVRAENAKLAMDGKKFLNDEEIKAAEDAATAQARKDQIQADLAKLKKELSELAQISGGKLSEGDKKEVLDRWKSGGGTKADAAGIYEKENHVGEGGGAGIKAGIDGYLAQAKASFDNWKGFATNTLTSTENAFGTFFASLTQKGSTFGQKTKALWQGISSSVTGGLSKIAAQHLITWGIEKAKLAWDAIRSAWNTKDTAKTVTENTTKSASNTGTAATGFFASFAGTGPWGYALAAAAIIAMFALLGSVTGRKVGGVVGKNGPEMTMLGEEGLEVVAPEHDFKHWAANLKTAGADMGYNLGRHEAQISSLNSKAGSYAPQAMAQGGGTIQARTQDFRGSTIITTDSRQWSEMVHSGQDTWARANG